MNTTSNQTAKPKFRVGQRVLTTFGHGTVERLTECSAAVHLRDTVEAQREYIYSLKAAVLELRASEQLVRTHSGGPWVHRTPPSSVCARLQAAWAAVHLLLEQGEGADNG